MIGPRAGRRALVGGSVSLLAVLTLAAANGEAGADAWGALREGNDLFRGGRIVAAVAAYEAALAEARGRAHEIARANRDKLNAEIDSERAEVDAARAAIREVRVHARFR